MNDSQPIPLKCKGCNKELLSKAKKRNRDYLQEERVYSQSLSTQRSCNYSHSEQTIKQATN